MQSVLPVVYSKKGISVVPLPSGLISKIAAIKVDDIARVKIRSTKPLFANDGKVNRVTGSRILVDEASQETVAEGMVRL